MDWDKVFNFFKATFAVGTVATIAYLGETGQDGGAFKDLWLAAKTASPFAAMFAVMSWLWERRDRARAQQELLERTISFVEAMNEQSSAREKMVSAIRQLSSLVLKQQNENTRQGVALRKRGRR
jgi:hypothetical protein